MRDLRLALDSGGTWRITSVGLSVIAIQLGWQDPVDYDTRLFTQAEEFHMRRVTGVGVALSAAMTLLLISPAPASAQLQLTTYVTGLSRPVGFVQDPGQASIQYVIEQAGRIRTIVNGTLLSTPFLDVSTLVSCCGEQGLLGLAFPPDYATSGRFYVNYTNATGNTVVARFLRSASNPLIADTASRFPLRWGGGSTEIFQPFANHNGGHIAFGPDSYLYIGMGDGGSANDPQNNAQNATGLLGKMLRIDVNVPLPHPNGYIVPTTNPWVGTSTLPEIWASGLRNPWKFSFDPPVLGGLGSLIIGDVGQNHWEEVDYEGAGCSGRNYGWRTFEGNHVNPNPLTPAPVQSVPGSTFGPMLEYSHPTGFSVVGGVVYRGQALRPSYWGRYFYGDLNGRVWSAMPVPAGCGATTDGPSLEHTTEAGSPLIAGNLTAIGMDAAGEMYFVNYSAGAVFKLIDPLAARIRRPATDFYGLHDRRPDLVWFNESTRQLAAWHMGGALGNEAVMGGELLSTPALPAGWRVVGSFSKGLGETELFLQSDSGQLGMWVFNGREFHHGVNLNPASVSDPLWRVRAVGDFNHDGHADLLWHHTSTRFQALWLMNGETAIGYAGAAIGGRPGPEWEIFGTGDSDLDGELDLYWQNRTTGTLALWRLVYDNHFGNLLLASTAVLSDSPGDPGWRAVGVSDLDLDGSPDIIFQHVASGTVATWYLDGVTVRTGIYLNPSNVGDSNWKLVGPR